ncbi:MAG: Mannosyl oligosaccharide glucosidase [Syntrophorhabdaceae bacterium PtaU1.Bin034]|nr:MAG: Mannosyl oligosaccharide glucosidase [Syntrophorhabdaceae bacterium PtaU1.Bin034]
MDGNAEKRRMEAADSGREPWKKWGPYVSERQWGTVREDYSDSGNAWDYFTHDQARSRVYHWGEDGIAGISDDKQVLCFALALWNGRDPILKERMFGVTNGEGNHGEDVKEYYFYLDNTPTHSYMKYLYKYPQGPYPYTDLVWTNRGRSRWEFEYELLDTGIFDENRYFDVFVEYAKDSPEEILVKITVRNRGPQAADLDVLPTLWFRNTWSWMGGTPKPRLLAGSRTGDTAIIEAVHEKLGSRYLYTEGPQELLFTDNETNNRRLFGSENPTSYVKDGVNDYIVSGNREAVNPDNTGTKAAARYHVQVGAGKTVSFRLRLSRSSPEEIKTLPSTKGGPFGRSFDETLEQRKKEADEFYQSITPPALTEQEATVMRQAFAGMLWTKQYYSLDAEKWLVEHHVDPLAPSSRPLRNKEWFHMVNNDIISMPDKWEYPWYAAWDLAFHAVAFSGIDIDFAKQQLSLILRDLYLHPNGQMPAYEWNFSDVNPPVHAWASLYLYRLEQEERGKGDIEFLKHVFNKLMINFTWWVNRKDRFGKNVFEGGFLGLDNIGVFDRSAALPTGGYLEQADGTAWMVMFCQNMLEIATELAAHDPVYDDLATKFVDHFLFIAAAMNRIGGTDIGLWDEEDGFYYDVLRFPDGRATPLRVRSMVGLLPLCAVTIIEPYQRELVPRVLEHARNRIMKMPELSRSIHETGPEHQGVGGRGIMAVVNQEKLRRILARLLDEKEFLSPYGIRSLSRYHADHPYTFYVEGAEYRVDYLPAESNSGMFGGNSNWRGPVWFPMNALIIRALSQFYLFYGDNLKVECPTGSGRMMNLFGVSRELSHRLESIFLPDEAGRRPVYGGIEKFQTDPHWKDLILFYEYFHGDNGAGLGAGHQTGWTGLIARLMQLFGAADAQSYLETGKKYHPAERHKAA